MTVELIEIAAVHLGDLRARVVFLGGATVGLWFTDPAARGARATYDVDVVAEVVLLVDAREELAAELDALPHDALAYVRGQLGRVLALSSFEYGIEGALAAADSRERARTVTIPRLATLAGS